MPTPLFIERTPSGHLVVPAATRREAQENPALNAALDEQLGFERVRHQHWMDDYHRRGAGGAGWSGAPVEPYAAPSPELMLAEARRAVVRRAVFAASPAGQYKAAIDAAEAKLREVGSLLLTARTNDSYVHKADMAALDLSGLLSKAHDAAALVADEASRRAAA